MATIERFFFWKLKRLKEFVKPLKTKRRPLYLKAQSVPRC